MKFNIEWNLIVVLIKIKIEMEAHVNGFRKIIENYSWISWIQK